MLAIRFVSLSDIQLKLVQPFFGQVNCANPDRAALGTAVWSEFAMVAIQLVPLYISIGTIV